MFVLYNQQDTNNTMLLALAVGYNMGRKALKQSRVLHLKKSRIKWSVFNSDLSDFKFRRMFRMTRACFNKLCSD